MNIHNDEKGELGLDKYEGESEGEKRDVRYIFFPFVALFPPQKESNRPTNIGKGIKSLNHLICILQIYYSEKC